MTIQQRLQPTAASTNSVIRTLLVDDIPEFLMMTAEFLAIESRIEIIGQASSGEEALKQIASLSPDLVLMDVAMPGMNGLETTRRIKAQPGAPYVIILTMYDNAEYHAEARTAGADGFMAKSELATQLLPLIYDLTGL